MKRGQLPGVESLVSHKKLRSHPLRLFLISSWLFFFFSGFPEGMWSLELGASPLSHAEAVRELRGGADPHSTPLQRRSFGPLRRKWDVKGNRLFRSQLREQKRP